MSGTTTYRFTALFAGAALGCGLELVIASTWSAGLAAALDQAGLAGDTARFGLRTAAGMSPGLLMAGLKVALELVF